MRKATDLWINILASAAVTSVLVFMNNWTLSDDWQLALKQTVIPVMLVIVHHLRKSPRIDLVTPEDLPSK